MLTVPVTGSSVPGSFSGSLAKTLPRMIAVLSNPIILSAAPHPTSVALSWSAATSAGGPTVTGYTVDWSPAGTTNGTRRVGNVTSTIVGNLSRNTSYSFQVAAWNSQGEGPFSPIYSVSTGDVPGAPIDVSVVAGDTNLTVSWSPPSLAGVYPILGYQLNVTPDNGTPLLMPNVTSPDKVEGLIDGKSYAITIRAWNEVGWGSTSPRVHAIPLGIPDAPENLSASFNTTDGSIFIAWSPPILLGGLPLDGYALSWTTSTGGVGDAYVAPDKLNYTIHSASPGAIYSISIMAQNSLGESAATMVSVLTPSGGTAVAQPSMWTQPWVVLGLFGGILTATFVLLGYWMRSRDASPHAASDPAPAPEEAHDSVPTQSAGTPPG